MASSSSSSGRQQWWKDGGDSRAAQTATKTADAASEATEASRKNKTGPVLGVEMAWDCDATAVQPKGTGQTDSRDNGRKRIVRLLIAGTLAGGGRCSGQETGDCVAGSPQLALSLRTRLLALTGGRAGRGGGGCQTRSSHRGEDGRWMMLLYVADPRDRRTWTWIWASRHRGVIVTVTARLLLLLLRPLMGTNTRWCRRPAAATQAQGATPGCRLCT